MYAAVNMKLKCKFWRKRINKNTLSSAGFFNVVKIAPQEAVLCVVGRVVINKILGAISAG